MMKDNSNAIDINELEKVSGGMELKASADAGGKTTKLFCECERKETVFDVYSGGRAKCRGCGLIVFV